MKNIEDLLNNRNADNKVYMCDLREWLDIDININKLRDIQSKLNKLTKGDKCETPKE